MVEGRYTRSGNSHGNKVTETTATVKMYLENIGK